MFSRSSALTSASSQEISETAHVGLTVGCDTAVVSKVLPAVVDVGGVGVWLVSEVGTSPAKATKTDKGRERIVRTRTGHGPGLLYIPRYMLYLKLLCYTYCTSMCTGMFCADVSESLLKYERLKSNTA